MSDLFDGDPGLARNTDPDTSHAAAEVVNAGRLMHLIYKEIAKYGEAGCISDEVMVAMPDTPTQSISPRFRQMIDRGMLELTGEKRKGDLCGRLQVVRRVLAPPFKKVEHVTPHDKTMELIRNQVVMLRRLSTRMRASGVDPADGVRLGGFVKVLEELTK
jgi:hypothetical protein